MILFIDNFDSFTYNLVDYVGKISNDSIEVYRNNAITLEEISLKKPKYIIISPGPKTPSEAGISKAVIETFGKTIPIFGVCLGHQAIGDVFGGKTVGAKRLMHGKTSKISHADHPLFKDVPSPFTATRYHSLVIEKESFPDCLDVIARSDDDNEIMAIQHKSYPIWGVQFHPESICSPDGLQMIRNFLSFFQ
jgi:anthranilate synthase component II